MPMGRRAIVLESIGHSHLNIVSPVRSDGRTWILSIVQHANTRSVTIGIARRVSERQLIIPGDTSRWPFGVKVSGNAETIRPASSRSWTICAHWIWNPACRSGLSLVKNIRGGLLGAQQNVVSGNVAKVILFRAATHGVSKTQNNGAEQDGATHGVDGEQDRSKDQGREA